MDDARKKYITDEAVDIAAAALSQAFRQAEAKTQIKSDLTVDGEEFELIFRRKNGKSIDMERS